MVEAQDANRDDKKKENCMANIEPVKIQESSSGVKSTNIDNAPSDRRVELEKSIISYNTFIERIRC